MTEFVGPGERGFCQRLGVSEDECDLEYKLDIIWKATKAYLKNLEDSNYKFAKKNHKFILDNGGSILEEWCHRVLHDEVETQPTTFRI